MSDFKVTPEYVSNAAASCDTTAADISDSLATLKQYVVNLEASWQGIASSTFQELMQEYDIYSTMLHDALTDIGSGLRGNYVNYTQSEQTNVNNINNINNDLGPYATNPGPPPANLN